MALVTIASFPQIHHAEMAKAHLESAGIDAFIADDGVVGANPFLSLAVGGVKVQVAEALAARAQAVLAEMQHPESADGSCLSCGAPMGEADTTCSACGWSFEGEVGR